MSGKRRNIGDEIIEGLDNAIAHLHGEDVPVRVTVHVPETIDIKAIRRAHKMTQRQFANRFGFKLTAVQEWEKGRRQPDRSARILLRVIEREPEAVERALAS